MSGMRSTAGHVLRGRGLACCCANAEVSLQCTHFSSPCWVPKMTVMPVGVLTGTQVEASELSVPESACMQDWHLHSAVTCSRARESAHPYTSWAIAGAGRAQSVSSADAWLLERALNGARDCLLSPLLLLPYSLCSDKPLSAPGLSFLVWRD